MTVTPSSSLPTPKNALGKRIFRLEPAFPFGEACCFHPVACPELLNCRGEVITHGTFGEVKLGRHIPYRRSVRRGEEHVALPVGEGAATLAEGRRGQSGIHYPLTFHHPADGLG